MLYSRSLGLSHPAGLTLSALDYCLPLLLPSESFFFIFSGRRVRDRYVFTWSSNFANISCTSIILQEKGARHVYPQCTLHPRCREELSPWAGYRIQTHPPNTQVLVLGKLGELIIIVTVLNFICSSMDSERR